MAGIDRIDRLLDVLGAAGLLGMASGRARAGLHAIPGLRPRLDVARATAAARPSRPPDALADVLDAAGALDRIAQPVLATDASGRIAFANSAARSTFGGDTATLVGRDACTLGLPFDARALAGLAASDGRDGERQRRVRLATAGDGERTALVDASPLLDDDGTLVGALLVVTDAERLAREQERIVAQLERANRIRSDFVATMSHELRTPLHVILGYADLLLGGEFGTLTAEQSETVARLLRRAHELHELVSNTLDVSRIDAGAATLHPVELHARGIAAEAVAECARRPGSDAVELVVDVPGDLPPILGDATKIKVVLKNLVGNALKFTERGRVSVSARRDGDGIAFDVVDTGIGVDPAVLPELFDAFRQADPSPSRRHGGVGLGLYIVRRLLDLVGGRISVESEPGRGSRFTAWIPLVPPSSAGRDADAPPKPS
ncbi:PAS domain-containing protein [bacterium]|nr:PAS domain-containing protein [bacterium]